jgi:hypothetical protein
MEPHLTDRLLDCSGITHIDIPNLQREAWIARASAIDQTTTFAAEVVCHAVPAQNGLCPVLEAWLEDFQGFFRVGYVVVVAEAVASEVVLVGAVASELRWGRLVAVE